MDLLLKSEQIKPVKFRIVSDNVQCADFQMLKDHFSITDLQKVNDSRLYRWLISVGETELAEKVKETYPTPESIDKDAIGFIKLFLSDEIKEFSDNPNLLKYLHNKHLSVFQKLLTTDYNLLLECYNSSIKSFIHEKEWYQYFVKFPNEKKSFEILDDLRKKLFITKSDKLVQESNSSQNNSISTGDDLKGNSRNSSKISELSSIIATESIHGFDLVELWMDHYRVNEFKMNPDSRSLFIRFTDQIFKDKELGKTCYSKYPDQAEGIEDPNYKSVYLKIVDLLMSRQSEGALIFKLEAYKLMYEQLGFKENNYSHYIDSLKIQQLLDQDYFEKIIDARFKNGVKEFLCYVKNIYWNTDIYSSWSQGKEFYSYVKNIYWNTDMNSTEKVTKKVLKGTNFYDAIQYIYKYKKLFKNMEMTRKFILMYLSTLPLNK